MAKTPKPLYDSIIQEMQYDKINFEPTLYSNPYSNESATKIPGFEVNDFNNTKDIDPLSKGLQGLQEERAQNQSNVDKWGNSLGKMSLTALATFLDGTVGTLAGATNMAVKGEGSAFWNNSVSNSLQDLLEWGEEVMPNYNTQEQANMPWYESMMPFSGNATNFWGDMVLKNMGFMVGTVASSALYGGLVRSALGAKDVARNVGKGLVNSFAKGEVTGEQLLKTATLEGKKLQSINQASQVVGSVLGSAGEARIEAIQSVRDYVKQAKEANPNISDEELMDDATNIGNAVFGMNMAILSIGNYAQFKDAIGGGYKLNKIADNSLIKGKLGNLTSTVESKAGKALYVGKKVGKALSNSAWEGSEEQLQKVAQEASKAFYSAGKDDKTEEEFSTLTDAFVSKLGDQFGSIDNWKDFAVGFISGGIGSPNVTNMKQSVWAGGMWNELSELKGFTKKAQDLAKAGNEASARVKTLYDANLKNIYLEKQKKNALELGDRFEWENANHAKIVNDINTMLELGRYEEYIAALDSKTVFNPSDIREAVKNDVSEDRYNNTTDDEIKSDINQRVQTIKNIAKTVREERDNLKVKFPGIDNNTLNELTYYAATEANTTERSDAIVKKLNELTKLQDGRTAQELAQFKATKGNLLNTLKESKDKINQAKTRINEILNKDYSKSPELQQTFDELNSKKSKLEEEQLNTEIQLEETLKESPKGSKKEISRQKAVINNKIADLQAKIEQLKYEQEEVSGENLDKKLQETRKSENNKLSKQYSDNLDVLENTKDVLTKLEEEETNNRSKIKEEASKEGLTYDEYVSKIDELVSKNEEFNKNLDNLYQYKPNIKSDVQPLLDDLVKVETRKAAFIKNLAKAYESNGIKTLSEELKQIDKDREYTKKKRIFDSKFKDGDIIYDKIDDAKYQILDDGNKKYLYKQVDGKWVEPVREFKYQDGALERYSQTTEDTKQPEVKIVNGEKFNVVDNGSLFEELDAQQEQQEQKITVVIEEDVNPTDTWFDPKLKVSPSEVQNKTTGNIGEVTTEDGKRVLTLKANSDDLDLQEVIRFQNFIEDNVFHTGEFKGKLISGANLFGDKWAERSAILESKGFNPNRTIYMIIVDKAGNEQKDKDGNLIFTTLSTQSAFTPVLDKGKPQLSSTLTKDDFRTKDKAGNIVPVVLLTKNKDGLFTSEEFEKVWPEKKLGIVKKYTGEFTDEVQILRPKFATNKEGWLEESNTSEAQYNTFIKSKPEFVTITHKTMGIPLLTEVPYDITEYIKDKGLKGDEFTIEVAQKNTITAFNREFPARKGFTYLIDKKNGKIIQLIPRELSTNEKSLVVDLLKTYCSNITTKDGKVNLKGANSLQVINQDGTIDPKPLSISDLLSKLIGFGGINNVSTEADGKKISNLHSGIRKLRNDYQSENNATKKAQILKEYNTAVASLNEINKKLAISKRSIFFQTEVHNLPTIPGGYIMIGLDENNNPQYKKLLDIVDGKATLSKDAEQALNVYLKDKYINVKAKSTDETFSIPTKLTNGKVSIDDIVSYNKKSGGYKGFLIGTKPSKGEKIQTPLTTRMAKTSKDFKTVDFNGVTYEDRVPTAANVYLGIEISQQTKPIENKKKTIKPTTKLSTEKLTVPENPFSTGGLTGKLNPDKLSGISLGNSNRSLATSIPDKSVKVDDTTLNLEPETKETIVPKIKDSFAGLSDEIIETTGDLGSDPLEQQNKVDTATYLSNPEKIFDKQENVDYLKSRGIDKETFLDVWNSIDDNQKSAEINNIINKC